MNSSCGLLDYHPQHKQLLSLPTLSRRTCKRLIISAFLFLPASILSYRVLRALRGRKYVGNDAVCPIDYTAHVAVNMKLSTRVLRV